MQHNQSLYLPGAGRVTGKLIDSTNGLSRLYNVRRILLHEQKSKDELIYVLQYMIQDTNLCRERWWQILPYSLQLELMNTIQLYYLTRDEKETIVVDENRMSTVHILIRGTGRGLPVEHDKSEIEIATGSVIGQLQIPHDIVSQEMRKRGWNALRKKSKVSVRAVVLKGPTEFVVFKTEHIVASLERLANQIERMKFLKRMRITVLKPWLREVSYEKGAVIVQQGNMPSKVIYVTKGSCIAYFRGKHSQKVTLTSGFEMETVGNKALAVLGPQAILGDISIIFQLVEPLQLVADGLVQTLEIDSGKFLDILKDEEQCFHEMQVIAFQTFSFIADRITQELDENFHELKVHYAQVLDTIRPTLPDICISVPEKEKFDVVYEDALEKKAKAAKRMQVLKGPSNDLVNEKNHAKDEKLALSMRSMNSPLRTSLGTGSFHRK